MRTPRGSFTYSCCFLSMRAFFLRVKPLKGYADTSEQLWLIGRVDDELNRG